MRYFRTRDVSFLDPNGVLHVVSRAEDDFVAQLREYYADFIDIARTIINRSSGKVAQTVFVQHHEHRQQP